MRQRVAHRLRSGAGVAVVANLAAVPALAAALAGAPVAAVAALVVPSFAAAWWLHRIAHRAGKTGLM